MKHAWLGLALSSMFFYPLSASITDGPYYMHWQWAHTGEFLVAWLVTAAVLAGFLWLGLEKLGPRPGLLLLGAVALVPVASMGIHLVRQLGLAEALIAMPRRTLALGAALPALAVAVVLVHPRLGRWRQGLRGAVAVLILIVSPLSLVTLFSVSKAAFEGHPYSFRSDASGAASAGSAAPASIRVILFDELDYGYLYEDREIRSAYTNFRAFADVADNLHAVRAPAGSTLSSIPGLLLGRAEIEIELLGNDAYVMEDGEPTVSLGEVEENLFAVAQGRGLRTRLYAAFHPHCRMFRESLDECDSTSIYNLSTLGAGFSPLRAIETNVILWPKDKPFGFVKAPVYAPYHKAHVDRVFRLGVEALEDDAPAFDFLHLEIPHLPFIYDAEGYNPPADQYLQNDENYENQLAYVDRVLGRYVDALKRAGRFDDATIVVMSDHAYRIMREEEDWSRIPMLVKHPGQTRRRDLAEPAKAGLLMRCLVSGDRGCYEAHVRGS